jgi:hypothetical protein
VKNAIRFASALLLCALSSLSIAQPVDREALHGQPTAVVGKNYNYGGKLDLLGTITYNVDNNTGQTTLFVEEISNNSASTTSGSIMLALIVTLDPIVEGQGFSYWIVARRYLNPLLPNYHYTNVNSTVPTESVPNGIYYIHVAVFEYENNCGSTSGYCSDDIVSDTKLVQNNGGIWSAYGAPPAATTLAVEYFNAAFGHYFVTADPAEIAGLDAGAYNYAFIRTGQTWKVWTSGTAFDVCRFFTTPGTFGTKSSHFYTAIASECNGLKFNPAWIYEKIAGKVLLPLNGVCPAGTIALYRLYNNGMTGAPNHRYTISLVIRSQMIAAGFTPEDANTACVPL